MTKKALQQDETDELQLRLDKLKDGVPKYDDEGVVVGEVVGEVVGVEEEMEERLAFFHECLYKKKWMILLED